MKNSFRLLSFLRFLGRNKLYTAINIFGFAVSLAVVVLLAIFLEHELSVDKFHEKKDRIFMASSENGSYLANPYGPDLQSRYPEIEAFVRIVQVGFDVSADAEGKSSFETDGILADSTFFSVFSFPLIEGRPESVMRTPQDVVLNESLARQMFGNEPALGKTIYIREEPYIVSGVAVDFKNSHIKNPGIIVPYVHVEDYWSGGILNSYNNNSFSLYLLGRKNADLASKAGDMLEFFKANRQYFMFNQGFVNEFRLIPVDQAYFDMPTEWLMSFATAQDAGFMTMLIVVVLLVLAFAVVNYINLTVAQAGYRAREAATRRLLGGNRRGLIAGFITESILLCLFSFVLALFLAKLIQPWFREVLQTEVALMDGLTLQNSLIAAAGLLVIGALSGLVPAMVLTRIKPIEVVRGTFQRQTKMVYSRVLIAFQYCITIALLGCTLTIVRQIDYMVTTDLGFKRDNLIVARTFTKSENLEGLKSRLLQVPGVEKVAFGYGVPMMSTENLSFVDDEDKTHSFTIFEGDSTYLELLGFDILRRTGSVDPRALWLNETAWRSLGVDSNATFYRSKGASFFIKGVVRDFNIRELNMPITEVMIRPFQYGPRDMLIRVSAADPFGTMKRLQTAYNDYMCDGKEDMWTGYFVNDRIEMLYEKQNRTATLMTTLTGLAMLISTLGMLAMATYFIRQRESEIAVRKVFGSTEGEVLRRLVRSFMTMVLIAFILAIPVIWYLMNDWLSGYAYRISLSWTIFALAGALAFVVALLTVLGRSIQAARTNPVVSLKR